MGRPMNPGMMMGRPMKGNAPQQPPQNLKRKQPPVAGKKGGNKKKAHHQPQDPYPMDKEWVTDAIREQLKKKEDVAERLKGNKNDELFAQFKAERDVFVKLYDEAKKEWLVKNPPKVVPAPAAKDAKEAVPATTTTTEATPAPVPAPVPAPAPAPVAAVDADGDTEMTPVAVSRP